MNTDTNTIFKLDVCISDNNDDIAEERDYAVYIYADIIKDDKSEVLFDSKVNPATGETEDYYDDNEFAEYYIDNLNLNGLISVEEMVTVIKTTMNDILSKIPYPEFSYESVPLSYAPWCYSDSPPEVMMPFCNNNTALGDYKLNVVRENGEIKIIKE